MNHDYTHCYDYFLNKEKNNCLTNCFRKQLVDDLENYSTIVVSWAYLKGTNMCPISKGEINDTKCKT